MKGITGICGGAKVFLGFASARLLHSLSFPDVLDEETGEGYQRRFSRRHSLDFARYIQEEKSSTIPLTFNLRPQPSGQWTIHESLEGLAEIRIKSNTRILAQVDCQHRLGCLNDKDVPLAFMAFIGLSLKEEMQIFNVINGKARGLSSSLIDHHESVLLDDVATQRPELYLAIRLDDDSSSPWFHQLDRGGTKSVGMTRRASLRTMQNAIRKFLRRYSLLARFTPDELYTVLLNFWLAIVTLLKPEWRDPRKHVLTKGIGVYALTSLAGEIVKDGLHYEASFFTEAYFVNELKAFIRKVDWRGKGSLKGLGGDSGAQEALDILESYRSAALTH
jgi:DNA sulfur modification protein DndB